MKTEHNREKDGSLLSQVLIELNISRLNVSMYPQNHPIVENSLNRAYTLLQELTDMQERVTISVAKDVLIINEHPFEEKNPALKEFALSLNRLNIAQLTLVRGLNKDELYAFHRFLITEVTSETSEDPQKIFEDLRLMNILVEFIDYSLFTMDDEDNTPDDKRSLWEEYVFGLMEGKYQAREVAETLEKVPPEKLAELLNAAVNDAVTEELYGELMDEYFKRIFSKEFTGKNLQYLLAVVNDLRYDLKRQFLNSAVQASSAHLQAVRAALNSISSSEIMNFLSVINEHMVRPPDALKNVLDEFSRLSPNKSGAPKYGGGLMEDDFLITPEMTKLLKEATLQSFVSDSYQGELQQFVRVEKRSSLLDWVKEYEQEWRDETIEKDFCDIVLELALSGVSGDIEENERELYINIIKDQIEQFIVTGQYAKVLSTFDTLAARKVNDRSADLAAEALQYFKSDEFMPCIIDSLRLVGRQRRHEALQFCEYYGDAIINPLLDALTDEESPTIRRFLISLVSHFGDSASHEILKRLTDTRWYVLRNMLFILLDCASDENLKKTASLCRHSNSKVSFEAIKCLLKAQEESGIKALRNFLCSDSDEVVTKSIEIAGAFRVRQVVPDLIRLLEQKNRSSKDVENKMPVVRALGLIGDPRAKDALLLILDARALMFRSAREKLKEEVRRALKQLSSAQGEKTEN